MVFAEASFLISKVSTELLADEFKDSEDLLEEEELLKLLDLLEDEQLEFDELELELELELDNKPSLNSEELFELELELELELEQIMSGGLNGVVRSAPQPCNSSVDNSKNANALSKFG